jgi:adenylosuccinate lyase
MTDDRYRSPLGTRYASPEMQRLWGEPHRIGLWRRVWLALAESEKELGLAIPDAAISEMRTHLDDADLVNAAEYEKRFRHDVMAHVHTFGEQAPAARAVIHLGATSAFVTDNADVIVIREGMKLLLGRMLKVLGALENRELDARALETGARLFAARAALAGLENGERPERLQAARAAVAAAQAKVDAAAAGQDEDDAAAGKARA